MSVPTLVTVAHGTRHATGNEVAVRLTEAVAARLDVPAVCTYVELCEPIYADVMAAHCGPAVVVPLLLSTGFHVREDLPAGLPEHDAVLGPSLGPDPLLAAAQIARLRAAGARPGQPVTMIAAGTRDPEGVADLERQAAILADAWGAEVRLSTLSAIGERPGAVVRPGDAVSLYLLSAGYFSEKGAAEAREAGATVVSDVLGPHDDVVDAVAARYRMLAGALTGSR